MASQKNKSKAAKKLKPSRRKKLKKPPSHPHNNVQITEQLASAKQYLASGLFVQAEATYMQVLSQNPTNIEANYNLSLLNQQKGKTQQAIEYMLRVVKANPDIADVYSNLGIMQHSLGQIPEALTSFSKAVELMPEQPSFLNNLGKILQETGSLEDAIKQYRKAIQSDPHNSRIYANLGIALDEVNETDEAIACHNKAVYLMPANSDAHYSLAVIFERKGEIDNSRYHLHETMGLGYKIPECTVLEAKLFYREENFQKALEKLSGIEIQPHNEPRTAADIFQLSGKAYDRLGNEEKAFDSFSQSNKVLNDNLANSNVDPQKYRNRLKNLTKIYTREWTSKWENIPVEKKTYPPVFIVGFPRSGTTLLDQILNTHSKIEVIEEKDALESLEKKFFEKHGDNPENLSDADKTEVKELRNYYFDKLESYLPGSVENKMLIDKFPLNITRVFTIKRFFPEAKIILALRHPYDLCLSNFMQYYKINNAMANFLDLHNTAKLYDITMKLWNHFTEVLEIDFHTVKYESVVENTEYELRALFNFLSLPWENNVLDYHQNASKRKFLQTPSYQDIGKPIFSRAKYRWKRYKPYLEPVLPILRSHALFHDYEVE